MSQKSSRMVLSDTTNLLPTESITPHLSLSTMVDNLTKQQQQQQQHTDDTLPIISNNTFLTATNDTHTIQSPTQQSSNKPNKLYTINNTQIILPHIAQLNTSLTQQLDTYPSHKHKQPKLLTQITNYINTQLADITKQPTTDAEYHTHHQIYTQALHMFSIEFSTYQSLLDSIQQSYDNYIKYLLKQNRDILYYKQQLSQSNLNTQNKLNEQSKQFNAIIDTLNQTIEYNKTQLHSNHITINDINMKLNELQKQYDQLHHSHQALHATNKTLVSSLTRYEQQVHNDDVKYNTLNEQYNTLKHELHTIQTNYYNLIDELHLTRNEHATYHQQRTNNNEYNKLQTELNELKKSYDTQTYEYNTLIDSYTKLQNDTQSNQQQIDTANSLLQCNTPRPQWRTLLNEHTTLTHILTCNNNSNKTTNEYINELLEHIEQLTTELHDYHTRFPSISEIDEQAKHDSLNNTHNKNIRSAWLKCRGDDESIPKWLRGKGRIRNKLLSKRETELFIKEIWSTKYSSSEYKSIQLNDYMYIILKQKYTVHDKIIDYAYNFMDALDRYSDDPDCMLLLSILQQVVPEQLYNDQALMVSNLQHELIQLDQKLNKKIKYRLTRKQVLDYLRIYFNTKSDESLKLINIALYKTDQHNEIHYMNLFNETREGDQTQWLECIREQHVNEVFEFTNIFYDKLRYYITNNKQLTIYAIRQIFNEIDCDKRDDEIDIIIRAGLQLKQTDTIDNDTIIHNIEQFITNCSNVLIKRSGKDKRGIKESVPQTPVSNTTRTISDRINTPHTNTVTPTKSLHQALGLPSKSTSVTPDISRNTSMEHANRVKSAGVK